MATFEKLEIPGLALVTPKVFLDERGHFYETYKLSEFEANGIGMDFVQDNQSLSSKGTLRGLHYQLEPKAQGKLIRVVRGSIYDVVVDIRKGSPTYGHYAPIELNEDNKKILWVPPGFAHGFLSLEDDTEIFYKNTNEYAPETMRGILWCDPEIGIVWPIVDPILSEKDANAPLLKDAENNFVWRQP